eukprot:gene27590-39283_t
MSSPSPADVVGQWAVSRPDAPCVIDDLGRVNRGLRAGERVVCYGHNSHEWVLVRSAAAVMNTFFVPMNWHLTAGESLAHVVASGDLAFPSVDAVLGRLMAYTGGTSGRPKAVIRGSMLDHERPRPPAPASSPLHPGGLDLVHDANVHLIAAPMYHAAPNFFGPPCAGGAAMVVMRRFDWELPSTPDAATFASLVERHHVKCVFLPPILVKRVVDLPPHHLSRCVLVAGAPCPMSVKERALALGAGWGYPNRR